MASRAKGVATCAKNAISTIPFTIYAMTFHLGTGLYSYWC